MKNLDFSAHQIEKMRETQKESLILLISHFLQSKLLVPLHSYIYNMKNIELSLIAVLLLL